MDMITTLVNFINAQKEKINFLAMITKFKQREGYLNAITFLLTFTVGLHELNDITLDLLASKCEEYQAELNLTKQGLFQRLDNGSNFLENFFITSFEKAVNANCKFNDIDVLQQFDDVKFTDGTTISLPKKLENLYKGMGGRNSDAALKVQATYSLFKNKFTKLDLYDATKNDNTYTTTILEEIQENELQINDLGYFNKKYFEEIQQKRAYYVSRIKKNTLMYVLENGEYKEVSLEELIKPYDQEIDKEIYMEIDSSTMLPVRLAGIKLPENVANEKLRIANKIAKNKGKVLSKKEKLQLSWFLVITNVSSENLSIKTVCELYRLRWQIELCFKALKSGLDFDKFSNCGEKYFKCLLYGKLIFITFMMQLYSVLRTMVYLKSGRLISIQRFVKNLRARMDIIKNLMLNPCLDTLESFKNTIFKIIKRSLFEIRFRKTTEYELMEHKIPFHLEYLAQCSNL